MAKLAGAPHILGAADDFQPHYLSLPLPFFSILVGVFVFLVVLLQVRALRFAYMSIGFSAGGAMLVLLGSLAGSYFNIPVAQLPERHLLSGHHVLSLGRATWSRSSST